MAILRPRKRIVYFRVSEDEFRQLSDLCETQGARSLSDLTRSAVRQLLLNQNGAEMPENKVVQRLERLDAALSELNQRLKDIGPRRTRSAQERVSQ